VVIFTQGVFDHTFPYPPCSSFPQSIKLDGFPDTRPCKSTRVAAYKGGSCGTILPFFLKPPTVPTLKKRKRSENFNYYQGGVHRPRHI
jgi:hypothetical protein